MSESQVSVTRQQLAAILGVHPDRISEYTSAGLPVLHRGGVGGDVQHRQSRYDAIACAKWVRAHRPGQLDAQQAKARRDRSQADLNDLRLAERRGELVSAKEVERRWAAIVVDARTQLLGVPTRLRQQRPDLTRADVAAVDELLREALAALADGRAVDDPRDGMAADATSAPATGLADEAAITHPGEGEKAWRPPSQTSPHRPRPSPASPRWCGSCSTNPPC